MHTTFFRLLFLDHVLIPKKHISCRIFVEIASPDRPIGNGHKFIIYYRYYRRYFLFQQAELTALSMILTFETAAVRFKFWNINKHEL